MSLAYAIPPNKPQSFSCRPFRTNFSGYAFDHSFTVLGNKSSVSSGPRGLELHLSRPLGNIKISHGVNNRLAEGATLNSTFTILYGKVTFEMSAPRIPGLVTAAILIGDQSHDEIDIELLGGDPRHWQSNIFAPARTDLQPLYGVFSGTGGFSPTSGDITRFHRYSIDWKPDVIRWAVDGRIVRTLNRGETQKNGSLHFPAHPLRVQLGIWDASSPEGTAVWAHGPVDWTQAPRTSTAIIKSLEVEC